MECCSFCGGKLKLFESITWEISNDNTRGVCGSCHKIFKEQIDRRIDGAATIEELKGALPV